MAALWRLRHLPYRAQIGSCLFIVGGFLVGDVGGAFVADVGEVAGGVVWVPAALVNLAVAKSEVKSMCTTFIDYSAAFDSVSHKYIDATLRDAGASIKTRKMFRAIYDAASAVVKVSGVDGKVTYSEPFPIKRGVLQGDVTSPV